jgi:hypothetical protein
MQAERYFLRSTTVVISAVPWKSGLSHKLGKMRQMHIKSMLIKIILSDL